MGPKVAVVGAGPLGLVALKTFREDGFEAVAFESRPHIGGIWQPCEDSALSVTECTVFNSSKYRSAFSDFPFSDDTDDFPTWRQMHDYLESYVDYFGIKKFIHLDSRATNLKRAAGKWLLEITPTAADNCKPRWEEFDKICVATGTFVTPKLPTIEGVERFKGRTLHAVSFSRSEQFDGQNVLIIGLHATTQDVAICLKGHAKRLYLSHRTGLVMVISGQSPIQS